MNDTEEAANYEPGDSQFLSEQWSRWHHIGVGAAPQDDPQCWTVRSPLHAFRQPSLLEAELIKNGVECHNGGNENIRMSHNDFITNRSSG